MISWGATTNVIQKGTCVLHLGSCPSASLEVPRDASLRSHPRSGSSAQGVTLLPAGLCFWSSAWHRNSAEPLPFRLHTDSARIQVIQLTHAQGWCTQFFPASADHVPAGTDVSFCTANPRIFTLHTHVLRRSVRGAVLNTKPMLPLVHTKYVVCLRKCVHTNTCSSSSRSTSVRWIQSSTHDVPRLFVPVAYVPGVNEGEVSLSVCKCV